MKHNYTGASLKELKEKYGTGDSGFYSQSWYESEPFFTEHADKGRYEINLEKSFNKTLKEQTEELGKDFQVCHPAIIVEAVLTYYKATSERLLEDWYVRTSSLDSDGVRVSVGSFDAEGLGVGSWDDDSRDSSIGVSGARKLLLNTGNLEPIESFCSCERCVQCHKLIQLSPTPISNE